VPWKILIDRTSPPLPHIRLLATQRRAHLVDVGDLPFSCVALIHPHGSAR
jgi:PELOTA RNA binding domain